MQYRVYLFDDRGHISAAEFFPAADDREAAEIAAALYDSCSDTFAGYEVWRGADRVPDPGKTTAPPGLQDVIGKHRESILDLAESLQRSFASVGRSKKLAELQDRLRGELGR